MSNLDSDKSYSKTAKLYGYSITLCEGKIVRNRSYYYSNKISLNQPINSIICDLVQLNLARCFSYSTETNCDYIKYDLHIFPIDCPKIYLKLEKIKFFDLKKIEILSETMRSYNYNFFNRTLGTRIKNDYTLLNMCVYFSNYEKINLLNCKNFLNELCFQLGLKKDFCIPVEEKCWLSIVALDFFEKEFKLKIYIQFAEDFDKDDFLKTFNHSKNYYIVKNIIESYEKFWGYQIAISNKNIVSYNFYILA